MRAYDELQLQRLKDPLLTYIRLSGGMNAENRSCLMFGIHRSHGYGNITSTTLTAVRTAVSAKDGSGTDQWLCTISDEFPYTF